MSAGKLCLPPFPRDFLKMQRRASQMSRGWKSLCYERRVKCQVCFSCQDEVKGDVTAAQLGVWAFHSLDRGEIRPKVKDRPVHRLLQA